jgi:hypothetical protein
MKLHRSLSPTDALLVGRLSVEQDRLHRGRPYLTISVWCPFCKRMHDHGWDDPPVRSDAVTYRVSHCHTSMLDRGYWIGLDPAARDHNREVLRQFTAMLARWNAREVRSLVGSPVL